MARDVAGTVIRNRVGAPWTADAGQPVDTVIAERAVIAGIARIADVGDVVVGVMVVAAVGGGGVHRAQLVRLAVSLAHIAQQKL